MQNLLVTFIKQIVEWDRPLDIEQTLLFTKITTVFPQIEPSDYLTESQIFRSPFKSPIKSPFKSPFKRKLSFGMPSSPDLNLDFLCGLDDTEGIAELFDMW